MDQKGSIACTTYHCDSCTVDCVSILSESGRRKLYFPLGRMKDMLYININYEHP